MNIFKKISLFFTYTSKLKTIRKELEIEYGARVDNIYRIYTVLNLPDALFEEPYNLRRADIDNLSKNYILDYRRNFSDFLVSRGMMELFDIYEVRKVDKYSYLLVFGFSLLNTKKLANNLIVLITVSPLIVLLTYFCYFIFKTFA